MTLPARLANLTPQRALGPLRPKLAVRGSVARHTHRGMYRVIVLWGHQPSGSLGFDGGGRQRVPTVPTPTGETGFAIASVSVPFSGCAAPLLLGPHPPHRPAPVQLCSSFCMPGLSLSSFVVLQSCCSSSRSTGLCPPLLLASQPFKFVSSSTAVSPPPNLHSCPALPFLPCTPTSLPIPSHTHPVPLYFTTRPSPRHAQPRCLTLPPPTTVTPAKSTQVRRSSCTPVNHSH